MNETRAAAPTPGRIVNYVLPDGSRWAGQVRPAIVAQAWPSANLMCNLAVFKGQSDDFTFSPDGPSVSPICGGEAGSSVVTLGSVSYSAEPKPGTWHWPARA